MWFSLVLFSFLVSSHAAETPTVTLLAAPRVPQGASKPIVNNFVSLSIAIHWFQDYTRQGSDASQPNTFTRNLLNSLTESTSVAPQIRIGGTSADRTTYVPDQEETIKTVTGDNGIPLNVTLSERWFRQCFEDASFPPGTKFIFDLPLMRNDSGAIDNTVRGAQWALGAIREERFVAFEIGNEEDLYPGQGVTPRNWSVIDYVERWKRFAGAILERAVKPSKLDVTRKWFQGLVFAGLGFNPDWTTQTAFAAGINEGGLLKSVSLHNYPAGSAPWVTLGRTFMNHGAIVANISQINDDLEFLQSSPETRDLDFVLGETNIDFVNLNMEQFEGVLGSALWTIDYILYAAFSNVARVYLHQGTTFGYAAWQPVPVNGIQPKVRPPWYGLKFAAEAIGSHRGPIQIATVTPSTNESVDKLSVYAIYESSALARIAIINFNEWNATTPYPRPAINFRIALGLRGTKATGRRLTAPEGASADTGLSFGGVAWNYSMNGIPENVDGVDGDIVLEADSNGVLEVGVKSSEAMLVQLQ